MKPERSRTPPPSSADAAVVPTATPATVIRGAVQEDRDAPENGRKSIDRCRFSTSGRGLESCSGKQDGEGFFRICGFGKWFVHQNQQLSFGGSLTWKFIGKQVLIYSNNFNCLRICFFEKLMIKLPTYSSRSE